MSEGNGFAGRVELFKPAQRQYEVAEIPHVGKCRFRSWTEADRSRWEQRPFSKKGEINHAKQRQQRLAMVAYSWCDGDGNLILSEEDITSGAMLEVPSIAIAKMAEVAMRLSGIFDDDIGDEKN